MTLLYKGSERELTRETILALQDVQYFLGGPTTFHARVFLERAYKLHYTSIWQHEPENTKLQEFKNWWDTYNAHGTTSEHMKRNTGGLQPSLW